MMLTLEVLKLLALQKLLKALDCYLQFGCCFQRQQRFPLHRHRNIQFHLPLLFVLAHQMTVYHTSHWLASYSCLCLSQSEVPEHNLEKEVVRDCIGRTLNSPAGVEDNFLSHNHKRRLQMPSKEQQ